MKRYGLSIIMICLLSFACIGCGKGDSSDVVGSKNPIANSQDEQPSDTINNGANESDKGTNEGGIIVDEEDTPDEEEIIYQEPYTVVSNILMWINWFVEEGEVKEIEFSEYTAEIIPQVKYSKFGVTWAYVNEELYLGGKSGWYSTQKIPGCEDKVLLSYQQKELDYKAPFFRVFDINTKEILSIYPDYIEADYYVEEVWVSPDLSDVVFLTKTEVYYYDGTRVTKIEQFEDKLEGLTSTVITMEEGKILVLGTNSKLSEVCCYVYDFATDELIERKYSSDAESDEYIVTYDQDYGGLGFRYGRCYKNGYFTIVDLLTGREDKTEIPKEKIRHVENISEDWFFVLADYGYFIEKSTGRIVAKTEYEIAPSKEDDGFTVALVPSDEDIYFCLKAVDSEAGIIYKIELDE